MPDGDGAVVPGSGEVPQVQAPAHGAQPAPATVRLRQRDHDPSAHLLSAYGPDGPLADVPLPGPQGAPAPGATPPGAAGLPAGPAAATLPPAVGQQGPGREAEVIADHPMGGVKYDRAKPRIDLIPAPLLLELAKLYGMGAEKYAPRDWEAGFDWSRNYNGAMRHLLSWFSGEELDQENGQPHLIAAIWNLIVLRHFERLHHGNDDRPDHGPLP